MLKKILALGLFSLALGSCGGSSGSFDCNSKGSCPNDMAPTDQQKAACMAALSGKCSSQYSAAGNCAASHSMCGADGKTTTTMGSCDAQALAYLQCAQMNPM